MNVAVIPTPAAIEAAWERYRAIACRIYDEPELLADRRFMEDLVRAERAWKEPFLASEPSR